MPLLSHTAKWHLHCIWKSRTRETNNLFCKGLVKKITYSSPLRTSVPDAQHEILRLSKLSLGLVFLLTAAPWASKHSGKVPLHQAEKLIHVTLCHSAANMCVYLFFCMQHGHVSASSLKTRTGYVLQIFKVHSLLALRESFQLHHNCSELISNAVVCSQPDFEQVGVRGGCLLELGGSGEVNVVPNFTQAAEFVIDVLSGIRCWNPEGGEPMLFVLEDPISSFLW